MTKSFQTVEFFPPDQFLQKTRKLSPKSQMTVFFDPVPGAELMTPSFGNNEEIQWDWGFQSLGHNPCFGEAASNLAKRRLPCV